ncbi:MAG: 5-oxoprolinase subunit PxpA, partial [Verrucomicrobiota bacterium]
MLTIDLNCDLGEGGSADEALMPLITSANIACGGHAGNDATMRATLRLARRHGVGAGAHPGHEDPEHFGRRELPVTPAAAAELVSRQTACLRRLAAEEGIQLTHVKLHGALYNQASRDPALAAAVVRALAEGFPGLPLIALAGSVLEATARRGLGAPVRAEAFADRAYEAGGSLRPRGLPGALLPDAAAAERQVLQMLRSGRVRTWDGGETPLRAETLCLHGDGSD